MPLSADTFFHNFSSTSNKSEMPKHNFIKSYAVELPQVKFLSEPDNFGIFSILYNTASSCSLANFFFFFFDLPLRENDKKNKCKKHDYKSGVVKEVLSHFKMPAALRSFILLTSGVMV